MCDFKHKDRYLEEHTRGIIRVLPDESCLGQNSIYGVHLAVRIYVRRMASKQNVRLYVRLFAKVNLHGQTNTRANRKYIYSYMTQAGVQG